MLVLHVIIHLPCLCQDIAAIMSYLPCLCQDIAATMNDLPCLCQDIAATMSYLPCLCQDIAANNEYFLIRSIFIYKCIVVIDGYSHFTRFVYLEFSTGKFISKLKIN